MAINWPIIEIPIEFYMHSIVKYFLPTQLFALTLVNAALDKLLEGLALTDRPNLGMINGMTSRRWICKDIGDLGDHREKISKARQSLDTRRYKIWIF